MILEIEEERRLQSNLNYLNLQGNYNKICSLKNKSLKKDRLFIKFLKKMKIKL